MAAMADAATGRVTRGLVQGKPPPRTLSVLGATGSVGTSTLQLVAAHSDRFEIVALTAQRNVDALADLAKAHRARLAVIGEPRLHDALKERLAGTGIATASGPQGLLDAASMPADCVMAAIIGAAGLEPTFAAARQGRRIALANKECLVSAGRVFMNEILRWGTELLPVDSEHAAAFQLLDVVDRSTLERLVLTASGGPFRTWSTLAMRDVAIADALAHPNWTMGAKITVDSATLMNKGLELIEAHHMFAIAPEHLGVVVHPQSLVHCLVELHDGAVLAQLASPDMATPIALALGWPSRMHTPTKRLDLIAAGRLDFEPPDDRRFPALALARQALASGGAAPTVLNAANEVAVAEFLGGRLRFTAIAETVAEVMQDSLGNGSLPAPHDLGDVLEIDGRARILARKLLDDRRRRAT